MIEVCIIPVLSHLLQSAFTFSELLLLLLPLCHSSCSTRAGHVTDWEVKVERYGYVRLPPEGWCEVFSFHGNPAHTVAVDWGWVTTGDAAGDTAGLCVCDCERTMEERVGRVREAVLVICVTMFYVTLPLIHTYCPFFLFSFKLTKPCLTFPIPRSLFLSSSFYFLSLCPSPVSHLLPPISSSYLSFCCLFLSFCILRFILAFPILAFPSCWFFCHLLLSSSSPSFILAPVYACVHLYLSPPPSPPPVLYILFTSLRICLTQVSLSCKFTSVSQLSGLCLSRICTKN